VTLLMYADNMALRSSNPEDLLLTVWMHGWQKIVWPLMEPKQK
jgi:hypothetical protein